MNNTQRITLVSFLAYFVMSAMLAPIGIISGPMAELFNEPVTTVTARFSWLTVGDLIGATIAVVLFGWVPVRLMMFVVYALILGSLLSLMTVTDLNLIGVALGIVGVCCGLGLVGAALVISQTYESERRASMLVITDGCFSIAGFLIAAIAAAFIARNFHWASVYQVVAVAALLILVLTLISRFPATTHAEMEVAAVDRWPLSVWCCLGALFLYTLGQWSMLWWLPNYAETVLGFDSAVAGRLISLFWFGMFAAQILVAWWVLRVGVRRLVLASGVAATAFSMPLWLVEDPTILSAFAFIWGLANLGLLKVVLSFATQMLRVPSPRLVSSLLLGATVGTAVSPLVTSRIVELTDNYRVLQFSTACFVVVTLLLLIATASFRSATRQQGSAGDQPAPTSGH